MGGLLVLAREQPEDCHLAFGEQFAWRVVGVITAFNFPVAVWSWNAALALVCGNPVIWKPSELTPLSTLILGVLCGRWIGSIRPGGRRRRGS